MQFNHCKNQSKSWQLFQNLSRNLLVGIVNIEIWHFIGINEF